MVTNPSDGSSEIKRGIWVVCQRVRFNVCIGCIKPSIKCYVPRSWTTQCRTRTVGTFRYSGHLIRGSQNFDFPAPEYFKGKLSPKETKGRPLLYWECELFPTTIRRRIDHPKQVTKIVISQIIVAKEVEFLGPTTFRRGRVRRNRSRVLPDKRLRVVTIDASTALEIWERISGAPRNSGAVCDIILMVEAVAALASTILAWSTNDAPTALRKCTQGKVPWE